MAELIRKAIVGYNFVFDELADPRTKSWLFVAKPHQGLALLALYLMFVLKWGPKLMKDRQPLNLDKIMIVYNFLQVISCGYLFVKAVIAWTEYRWLCEPVDVSWSESALEVANLVYFYYQLKIADLVDTIFFVLRKKFTQISFLHVYHHTGMVMLIWGAVTYFPGGHGTSVGVLNSFVHCVMYSYYLLSVAFPAVKQSLRFKKFVTQIQILQFFLLTLHFVAVPFKTDCPYPRWSAAVFLPQNLFMLVLFLDFYIKTYVRKPKQKSTYVEEKITSKVEDIDEFNRENQEGNTSKLHNEEVSIQHLVQSIRKSSDSDIILRKDKRS